MPIRPATFDDLPAILAISNWAALNTPANFAIEPEPIEHWQSAFTETHRMYPWLVATDQDSVVLGFAKASPWKGRCAYAHSCESTVYVHPDHHGRGVGSSLYDQLFPMITAQGYCTAIAGITLPNDASVRLHEKYGLRKVAHFERIGWKFGRWHDVGYWQKALRAQGDAPTTIAAVAATGR